MDNPLYIIATALVAALFGGAEMRMAMHRQGKHLRALAESVHGKGEDSIASRLKKLETPKPDSWRHPTIAGLLLVSLAMLAVGGCAPTPRAAVDQLRADTIAQATASTPAARAAAAAAVKADVAVAPVVERLSERHALLRIAVAAIAVVAVCLVGAAWFPMLAPLLKVLGGAAGVFGGGVLALRSFLAVPEWIALSVFALVAGVAVFAMLRHGKSAAATVHDLVDAGAAAGDTVTGKARAFVAKVAAWRQHHVGPAPVRVSPPAPVAGA